MDQRPPLFKVNLDKAVDTIDSRFHVVVVRGRTFVKIWARNMPEGRIFRLWLPLEGRFILMDDEGEFWVYHVLLKNRPLSPRHLLAFPCQAYCSREIRRVHITCAASRTRKILSGKAQNPVMVKLYVEPVYSDIRLRGIRAHIQKFLHSLIEVLNSA